MERKRVSWMYREVDFERVEEKLENLKQEGWILEKVNFLYATFEKGKGEEVVYDIEIGKGSAREGWHQIDQVGGLGYYIGKKGCALEYQTRAEKLVLSRKKYLHSVLYSTALAFAVVLNLFDLDMQKIWNVMVAIIVLLICLTRWIGYSLIRHERKREDYMRITHVFNTIENIFFIIIMVLLGGLISMMIGLRS